VRNRQEEEEMSNGAAVTGAIVAAMANAIKASGAIVRVENRDFLKILDKAENPLVVMTQKGFLSSYKYIFSYKGLAFFTKSPQPLNLPSKAEIVLAKKIEIPS
jgi:hypothetical protein